MLCQVLAASGSPYRARFAILVWLALSLPGCASNRVEPATLESVAVVDYHAMRELPDKPPAPATYMVHIGEDGVPRVEPGPKLPAYLPGEMPGRRPHRAILRVRFASPANLSMEAETLHAPLNTDVEDCASGADLGGIRLTSVYWNGHKLPDRSATATIARAPKPVTYTLFLNVRLPASRVVGNDIEAIDLARHPAALCIQVSAKRAGGDRMETETLRIPAASITRAVKASGL